MNIIPFPSSFISQFTLVIDWEQRKLNEVADFNPKAILPNIFKYVDLESVVGNQLISYRLEDKNTAPSRAQRLAKTGDLFYQTVRPYQRNNYLFDLVADDFVFSTGYAQLRPKISGEFLLNLLQTNHFANNVLARCTGTSYPAINSTDLSKLDISVPVVSEESEFIGSLFSSLEKSIALHQRKLDALKHLKEAYLQSMFPENRESIRKLRFANFEENWEQRKIKAFSKNSFGGGTPKTSNKNYWDGEIPWIQSSDLLEHQVSKVSPKKKITKDGLKNSAAKLIPEDSIAIVTRVGVGKIALMDILYTTSQDFLSLSNLNVNKWFGVYSLYNHLQKEIHKVQGTSIKGITKSDLLTQKVCVPIEHAEQEKVGYFFKKIDDMISLQQQKLKQLQKLKKAYLQKMFI